ncbi:oxygen-independent coproporphyrinogen III oxidase [Salibacterium salarium]|uniref:Heme chaperone HemW n=1 Tax=Salibacterium salarium TaxID=284579 RepID=A0A3R9QN14_9BACI|nr:radical SAM family heme chaperone HemW [Salibacterium salarium]RSL34468.1 oxygen-independent coproporphyrinogen III oxidase [Salibacterium salarium]
MAASSIYVHIPFCEQICFYCDFNKFYIKNQPVDKYVEVLNEEMKRVISMDEKPSIETIYIGGGTPTALNEQQLKQVLDDVNTLVRNPEQVREFTVEVNPGEADRDKLKMMRAAGVNRLSIGVQSFNDKLLEKIGRGHSAQEAVETIDLAKSVGFENISIDLMFGLPEQTMEIWKDTISKTLELDVPHISAYSLKIEEKTMFYNWYRQGKIQPLPEDTEAEMYEVLVSGLHDAGYTAYEISNFSKYGMDSEHNKTYWKNNEYYGFGAGAHGYLDGTRYANIGPLPHYIKAIENGESAVKESHEVPKTEMMEEEMFMGLRMKEGVRADRFESKFQTSYYTIFPEVIHDLLERELLYDSGDSLHLTKNGKLLGNEVFEQFLLVY